MTVRILFHPLADGDLEAIYHFIAKDSPGRAIAFVRRLRKFCFSLDEMPLRGRRRDDLAAGVRTITFERRVVVAYRVSNDDLTVLRLVYAGRDTGKVHWPEV